MSVFSNVADAWDTTNENGSRSDGVPEGKHVAVVKNMVVDTNEKGSSLATTLYFPKFNREETCWNPITKSALRFVKSALKAVGLDGYGPDEVERHLPEAAGKKVKVTKKQNGKYRNFYFDGPDDSDVPF